MGLFGFCVAVPVLVPDPNPVVPPVVVPVALPLIEAPPVVELPAEPPAAPPACASANVLDSANAVARAMVVSFMAIFLLVVAAEQPPINVVCSVSSRIETSHCGDRSARSRDIVREPPEGKSVICLSSPFCKKIFVFF